MRKEDLKEFFSPKEILHLIRIKNSADALEIFIKTKINLINEKTGQENVPRFWAYLVQYVLK